MADGMFGLTPEEAMQQEQSDMEKRALLYGQMDPFARANAGMFRAGAGIADFIAPKFGGINPRIARAEQMQELQRGMDLTSPEGLMVAAKNFSDAGMTEQSLKLVQASRDLAYKQSMTNKYNRPGSGFAPSGTEKLINLKAQLEEKLSLEQDNEQAKFALEAVTRKLEGLSEREQKQKELEKNYGPEVAQGLAMGFIVPITLADGSEVMIDKRKFAASMAKGVSRQESMRDSVVEPAEEKEQSPYKQSIVPYGGVTIATGTKSQEKLDKGVTDLASDIDKAKLGVIAPAYENLSEIFSKYPSGENIPGIGYATNIPFVGAIFSGEEGRQNRQAVQRVFNSIMAESAGLSQTISEAERQTLANALQPLAGERDFIKAWETVKNIYNTRMSNIVKSANPEVLSEYERRTGNKFADLPTKEFMTKAKRGNKEEAKQSRLDVIAAVKRGAITKAEGKAILLDMAKEDIK